LEPPLIEAVNQSYADVSPGPSPMYSPPLLYLVPMAVPTAPHPIPLYLGEESAVGPHPNPLYLGEESAVGPLYLDLDC